MMMGMGMMSLRVEFELCLRLTGARYVLKICY